MADSITSSTELAIGLDYIAPSTTGGVTKTIYLKLPNPKAGLTESQIRTQMTTFINSQIILDPEGEPFSTTSIGTAYTLKEDKINIDLDG